MIAGVLGCFSPLLVYYGQETRMYALLAFLATLGGYAFVRAATRAPRWWIAASFALAAALWTQLYAALLVAALNAWYLLLLTNHALARRRNVLITSNGRMMGDAPRPRLPSRAWSTGVAHLEARPVIHWLAAQAAVVLLFSPWIPVAWYKAHVYTSPGHGSSLGWVLAQTATVFSLGYPASGLTSVPGLAGPINAEVLARWLIIPFLLAPVLGLAALRPQQRLLLTCWLAVPIAAIVLLSAGKRDFNARYLMEAAPAFFVVVAAGLVAGWQTSRLRSLSGACGLAVALVSVFTLQRLYADPAYARDDNRAAVQIVARGARPGAGVVLDAPYARPAWDYYAGARWPVGTLPSAELSDPAALVETLTSFTAARPQVWLVLWQDYYADPHELAWQWLQRHFYASDWVNVPGGIKVLQFDALPAVGLEPSGAVLGGQLRLIGYTARAAPGPSSDSRVLQLDMYWQSLARPSVDLAIATHLLDPAGNDYGDADSQPAEGRLPTTSWQAGAQFHTVQRLALQPWTGPGAYRIQLLVYDHHTLKALPAQGAGADGGSVLLPLAIELPDQRTSVAAASPIAPPALPAGAHRAGARFPGVGALAGYLVGAVNGQPVLTLFWEAETTPPRPYKVFVHALDGNGGIIGTGDSEPAAGSAPMPIWTAGELIRDPHQLEVLGDRAIASFEVGIYDPQSGIRVPVALPDGSTPESRSVQLPQ